VISDSEQQSVRIRLLGNPDFMRRLRGIFEAYDWDADADKASEAVVELVAREGGVTLPVKL
jgi:hypothetical protein